MKRVTIFAGALVLLMGAGTLSAQEADTAAAAADPAAAAPTEESAPAVEATAPHDWEFKLPATENAPGASANVLVVETEGGSEFTVVASGLPEVDALDQENRDVNAYTVWVVPGKDKLAESKMVGVLSVSPEGAGQLEATTELETFGVIVAATPNGAPDEIGRVWVLAGIPAQPTAPTEAVEEAAEDVADEMAEDDADQAADVAEEVSEGVSDVEEETAEAAQEEAPPAQP